VRWRPFGPEAKERLVADPGVQMKAEIVRWAVKNSFWSTLPHITNGTAWAWRAALVWENLGGSKLRIRWSDGGFVK